LCFLNSEVLNGTGALARAPAQDSNAMAARWVRLKLLTAISFGFVGGGEKLQGVCRHQH
jgi:hypothetical protein